jgi:hypothetical protein
MLFARINLRQWGVLGVLASCATCCLGAGVTLITHGNTGVTDGWVTGMADALSGRLGENLPIFRIDVATNNSGVYVASLNGVSGGSPLVSASGEIVVKLDWRSLANFEHITYSVANALAPALADTNLIPQLGGHALAEFPLHILGHSRGGSLVCELSQRLGEMGVWVDQVTTLDAHPINGDAPVAGYQNVLFAESYYQTDSFLNLVNGEPIPVSHWRRQTSFGGGYTDFFSGTHSDVHLWYHGTIDLAAMTDDNDLGSINGTVRDTWWTTFEQKGTNAGFIYSRLGGGDRYVTNRPNGSNSSQVRDGINRNFELGLGVAPNRTALMFNTGAWPNVIRLDLLSTNPVPQGGEATLQIYYQWAQAGGSSMAVEVWRDADTNPLNGNEQLLMSGTSSGTTDTTVALGTIPVPIAATNAPVGSHRVFVKLVAGSRNRVLYAAQSLQVIAGLAVPPWLDIAATETGMLVGVNGSAGQTILLEMSGDLLNWSPAATNTLSDSRWEIPFGSAETNEFFRAVLLP